jgi:PPM family protein phosphatase
MRSSKLLSTHDTADLGRTSPDIGEARPQRSVIVDFSALSHQGLVRRSNEDQFHLARFGRFLEPLLSSIPPERRPTLLEEEGFAMIVADGMGGANAGEVASEMAIQVLCNLVRDTPDWILSKEGADLERVSERMAERLRGVNEALTAHAESNPELEGMGTTMTLAVIFGTRMLIAHIGDSRAYLYRGGRLYRLTRDHTVAQEMLDAGASPLCKHVPERWRHALTRVVGGVGEFVDADIEQAQLADNDKVLLCSDGLTGMVGDDAIAAILARATTAQDACDELIAAALRGGGRDNVTVAVAHCRLPLPAAAASG